MIISDFSELFVVRFLAKETGEPITRLCHCKDSLEVISQACQDSGGKVEACNVDSSGFLRSILMIDSNGVYGVFD